ncbi:hypothetical protein EC957_004096 [Mortierella hygrophila]|uniref:Uncharacterized protein n=1 Tax=Mortierella hygrophila TaxID=979708 RepID=A0A9P6FIS9_9FUNG|nr:hypothetical protein EC957_004096 [Mortierella hygrophila]
MAFSISQPNKMVTAKRASAGLDDLGVMLLEMFSKSQRRRQKDWSLICRECRKLLDTGLIVAWSEDEDDDDDDDDDEKEYEGEDVGEDNSGRWC